MRCGFTPGGVGVESMHLCQKTTFHSPSHISQWNTVMTDQRARKRNSHHKELMLLQTSKLANRVLPQSHVPRKPACSGPLFLALQAHPTLGKAHTRYHRCSAEYRRFGCRIASLQGSMEITNFDRYMYMHQYDPVIHMYTGIHVEYNYWQASNCHIIQHLSS